MYNQTRVVGACVTGPSHIVAGQGCDDAFAWRQFGDSTLVLAAADGAGSVSGTSAWGSWAATQFVTSLPVARNLLLDLTATNGTTESAEPILRLLFSGALQHVAYHTRRKGLTLRETSTTLVVAVSTPERTWIAQIGDGIVAIPDGHRARTILVEEKGDHAATDTTFLQALANSPMSSAFQCVALEPVAAVALSTDGLRYQATWVNQNYAAAPGFFEAMWRNVDKGLSAAELRDFLGGLPLESDHPRDDKTLVMAVRAREEDPAWRDEMSGRSRWYASRQPPTPMQTSRGEDSTVDVSTTTQPPAATPKLDQVGASVVVPPTRGASEGAAEPVAGDADFLPGPAGTHQ
ncbi:PP2C family serine/threonine-protein phosphatase [Ornithinimicrobium cryptoxanthini]|uniref:PP2C family serine/threonine-protein phosphatase n=1 Tax=Ornithinimicrobium cryptoxanthini TaxID=2934161 RepID=UPI0021192B09|nr:PP2C family serine/threonine-protein phosphatase [Ornithinimicrobium cryptoxanthini]